MPDVTMRKFRCWSAESVARTVFSDIGALASYADAIFLAAHTPAKLDHRKGPELGSVGGGEAQVLQALVRGLGDVERNTLIAVTGSSGSGKSHVVRWVHAHLEPNDPRYHVLYVPRAVQTLRDLLRKIIEGLPGVKTENLMARVDEAISNVRPGELQERLVNEIKLALNWTLEDQTGLEGESQEDQAAREDRNSILGVKNRETGGREGGLAELIDVPQVKETLLRPDGRLGQRIQSFFNKTSRLDDNDEIFTRDDLPLKKPGVRSALRADRELLDLWTLIQRQPDDALELLEEALRVALPKAIGLRAPGGDTLDSLFRESRRALRAEGRDLVLVFEDLAQFGLVDGELYDQFVTQPGEDLAPLRVVIAITDGAYRRLEKTFRTRFEHEFHVGDSAVADRAQFLGRYLNLVRVGRDETMALLDPESKARDAVNWMVNACDTREDGQPCRFRDKCHASFGSVDVPGLGDVGLYPYNEIALERAFANLGGSPTPRSVLDECVSVVLQEADQHIANGDYPHPRTRETFDFKVRMAKDALLESNPYPDDPERNYRALVIWGDEEPLDAGVREAFNLGAPSGAQPRPAKPVTPSPALPRERPALPNPLLPLFQWQNGATLPESDVNTYRQILRDLVFDRLNLDHYLTHIFRGQGKEFLETLFNMTSIDIEGARGRVADPTKSIVFKVFPTSEDVRFLAAARWFRDHGHFDPSRGQWMWPEGYDAAELMVELEVRLDQWAAEVRNRMLERTGGTTAAQHAVGVRAVALAILGHDARSLDTAAAVLEAAPSSAPPASPAWELVDAEATRVVSSLKADEYVGDFAAVRQGDGFPQLVDPRDLDAAAVAFLRDPETHLAHAASSTVAPVVAQCASRLLNQLRGSSREALDAVGHAYQSAMTLLEGHTPAQVGRSADEVGSKAKDAGLFRPADGYPEFRRAIEVLANAQDVDTDVIAEQSITTLVRKQRSIREIHRLDSALAVVRRAMSETKRRSEESGTGVADVSRLQASVNAQLGELTTLTKSLGPGRKA